ncbi:MAG: MBL fold metallo-hydrolase [Nitrospirota bacterium]|nr:MBL fold metallo-hydrolase [Nitrospirota bacterium]
MKYLLPLLLLTLLATPLHAQEAFEKDVIKTSGGDLEITFIGHGTLMMKFGGKVIHVDPFSKVADYSKLPKADLLLITHEHQDHLDMAVIGAIRRPDTRVVLTEEGAKKLSDGMIMKNGDVQTVLGVKIEAVPAYNLVHKRENGQPYHPKGQGNGYVLTFGATRLYIAGDTENTPEMTALKNIDVAFLPMNLPYTMTPEMVADAAKAFKPKVLYPYHTGDSDVTKLISLMNDAGNVEVKIRKMK